jgi:hypothetical protein
MSSPLARPDITNEDLSRLPDDDRATTPLLSALSVDGTELFTR